MKEDQEIVYLDDIIDNFIMNKLSGQEMLNFFRLAIGERALEIAGSKIKTAKLLKINYTSIRNWTRI